MRQGSGTNLRRIRRTISFACVLCCLGSGCTSPLASNVVRPGEAPPATEPAGPYRIGADDTVEVLVWKEPEISGPVKVRPDGMISLPLTGDVRAAGLTADQLAASIRERLGAFIEVPHVAVRLAEMGSRRFYVVGNVHTPGVYPLNAGQTVLQAVAAAGGFTDFANRHKLRLLRQHGAETTVVTCDYEAVIRGEAQDILLEPNDSVVVP
jgi:polysaccharide biosynthesis/export protein